MFSKLNIYGVTFGAEPLSVRPPDIYHIAQGSGNETRLNLSHDRVASFQFPRPESQAFTALALEASDCKSRA